MVSIASALGRYWARFNIEKLGAFFVLCGITYLQDWSWLIPLAYALHTMDEYIVFLRLPWFRPKPEITMDNLLHMLPLRKEDEPIDPSMVN